MRCDNCDREMNDDEPVWRRWRRYWRLSLCAECKPDAYCREPQPCERCGRPVHEHDIKAPSLVYCGEACQKLIYWQRSNAKRDRHRERRTLEHACRQCGDSFTTSRSDAWYCSNKCRQAHWRDGRPGVPTASPSSSAGDPPPQCPDPDKFAS